MRYHWGLAVGHLYTHSDARNNSSLPTTDASAGHGDAAPGLPLPDIEMVDATAGAHANDSYAEDFNSHDDADEFLLRNREDDGWEDMEGSDHDHDHDEHIEDVGDSDDEAALMMMDML